jgi:hypothetical protein
MINHPIHWLHSQFVRLEPSGSKHCYLCGSLCTDEYTVQKGIADTFNSHYLARFPSSPVLCVACWWYFNDKKEHPDFRMMSLVVCRNSWQNWPRETMKADMTKWLEHGLEHDAYLAVSLSKKKHILLQAPMNAASSRELAIQVEEQVAHLSLSEWQHMDDLFMKLVLLGHNKGEILSGDLYGQTLKKHGHFKEALMYSNELEEWRKSPQIELLSYVTIVDRGEQINDGSGIEPSGGSTTGIREGAGDQANSSSPAPRRVERNRQRVSQQVSNGDLENVRGKSSDGSADYEQLSLFPE